MRQLQRFITGWTTTYRQQGCVGKILLVVISLAVIRIACAIPIAILSPSTPTPEFENTAVGEIGSTPTAVETIEPTDIPPAVLTDTPLPQVAPTPTEKVSALLPGLKPADVTVNLEERGFTCSSVEQGQLYYTRICNKDTADYSLHIEIYGRELFSVDFIDSTILQYNTPDYELAASFLGFMATMPYDGAVQQEARTWVESTASTIKGQGDMAEKTFAGVIYRLKGIPTAITLEMGDLP